VSERNAKLSDQRTSVSVAVPGTLLVCRGSAGLLKLAFANFAIERLAPEVRRAGTYQPAHATQPSYFELVKDRLQIRLTQGALLLPTDRTVSNLVDIWPTARGGKLFSASWEPERPWIPPRVVRLQYGGWMEVLGFTSCGRTG
jgi:ribosomal protein S16